MKILLEDNSAVPIENPKITPKTMYDLVLMMQSW